MRERKKQKNELKKIIQSYTNHVNIHDYINNFAYIHNYSLFDVGSFSVKMCKFMHFLYYTPAGVNALNLVYLRGWGREALFFLKRIVS